MCDISQTFWGLLRRETRAEELVLVRVQWQGQPQTVWRQSVGLNWHPGLKIGRTFDDDIAAERTGQSHVKQAVGNCQAADAGVESKKRRTFRDPVVESIRHIEVSRTIQRYAPGLIELRCAPDPVRAANLSAAARQRRHLCRGRYLPNRTVT